MKAIGAILILLLALSGPLGAQVASNSLVPGTSYPSLQAAIDAGTNNYTVWVYADSSSAGVYITHKANLNLVIEPGHAGPVRLTPLSPGMGNGLFITNSTNVVVRGFTISNYSTGVWLREGCTNIRLTQLEIVSNTLYGIKLDGPASVGCEFSSNLIIGGTGAMGVTLSGGSFANAVFSNTLRGLSYGVWLGLSSGVTNNRVTGNLFVSNVNSGIYGINNSSGNLLANNTMFGSGTHRGVSLSGGASSNRIASNAVTGGQYGVFCDSISDQFILWNALNDQTAYGVAIWNGPSRGFLVASNFIRSTNTVAGIVLGPSAQSNQLIANTLQRQTLAIQLTNAIGLFPNQLFWNDISSNTGIGISIAGLSHNAVLIGNVLHDNAGVGLQVEHGPTNLQILTNLFARNGSKGVWFISNATNILFSANTVCSNGLGLASGMGNVAIQLIFNNIFSNGNTNILNVVATPTLLATSNFFGATNRAAASKGLAGTGLTIIDPWLHAPFGSGGDFSIPAPPTALVASNGLPGKVNLSWGMAPPGDFAGVRFYRTTIAGGYPYLIDSDLVATSSGSSVTHAVDSPPASRTYYYYATVLDASGNESWYSPQATVAMDPPAAFTGPAYWSTNLLASFTCPSNGGSANITNYLWRFGDGSSAFGTNTATHAYAAALSGWVTLTVFNNQGQSNTASNRIEIFALSPVSGNILGTITNGVALTLSGAQGTYTTNSTAAGFVFLVSNGAFTLTPGKLGYRFSPSSRSVTVLDAPMLGQDFTAADIYPVLSFTNFSNRQYVVRDLVMNVSADAPEILSAVAYRFWNEPGTPTFSTNLSAAYGKEAVLDTTLLQDGFYNLRAEAVDIVFGRTHSNQILCFLDNQVFKILGKGLEDRHAIVYDNVIPLGGDSPVELFFHLKENQKVQIGVYDKWGKAIGRFPDRVYPHGPNRLVWDRVPKDLPAGVYYAFVKCAEYSVSVPIVFTRRG
ncbi:MAG: right-handed parallel beta-helix repeat-containing protein [Spirochaetes bacterium]|nr:right-handed parallel beta-helix repeat-containing protein [Spirochaetota bacterium]